MKKNRKILLAGGALAVVAASDGAFTAGVTTDADPSDVAASGNVTVAGAEVLDVDYGVVGTNLQQVTVLFDDRYVLDGPDKAAFSVIINGTALTFSSATILEDTYGADDDQDGEADATSVVFTADTPINGVTSTDIVVVSETLPVDDNGSTQPV